MNALSKKTIIKLAWSAASIAVLLALLFVPGLRPRDFLARRWQRVVPTVADDQLLPTLRNLANLGDDQLDFLVHKLGEEPRLARGAWQVLDEQLVRWQLLPTKESSRKVALLARLLSQNASRFHGESKRYASSLTSKLLVWPTDRHVVDTSRLIADCDLVLRESSRPDYAAKQPPSSLRVAALEKATRLEAPLPLPVEQPLPPLVDTSHNRNPSDQKEPGIFRPSQGAELNAQNDPGKNPSRNAKAFIRDGETTEPSLTRAASHEEWASRTTLEIIKLLQSPDVVEASQAAGEFRRRGFREVHLHFAQQLTSPNAQVRRKFAESLPLATDVDARPWLVWLSQDEDADVRLAAVSIMATNKDLEFRKRLRQMEREESDPVVLKQVQRSLR